MSSISWNATPIFSPKTDSGARYSSDASEKMMPTSAAEAMSDPAAAELLQRIERAVEAGDQTSDGEFAVLVTELRQHPVTEATLAEARRWAAEAVAALEPLPDGPVKKALVKFAETVVERSR